LPVIAVGGSNKNVGKTSLICSILTAFPHFQWTAVKLTSHDYGQATPVWEDVLSGPPLPDDAMTDTSRFLEAGARRAFLVTISEESLPASAMWAAFGRECNVIYESNRIVEQVHADIRLAVMAGTSTGFKLSFVPFLKAADAVIAPAGAGIVPADSAAGVPLFRLESPQDLSSELREWLRARLHGQ
jgi:hypothetical protein